MTTSLHKLSLPSSITSTNESETAFSRDLLRQFDKKRSQLHFELGFTSQGPSPESSIPYSSDEEPIQLDEAEDTSYQPVTENKQDSSHLSNRPASSVSASDLLRRSSAFLKSKFDAFKKPSSTSLAQPNTKATKVLMKTTIAIPSNPTYHHTIPTPTPPTITQYPPKPLVYSPIEPIVQPDEPSDHKRLLHRISMPLMRVYQHHESIPRNKSITTLSNRRRKSEPEDHTKRKIRRGK
ncbi:hypothetical protein EDC96DRAFT_511340 [Choanephora cucurbitarum]|nr:hypothetical protein EDC96DRAFT_511340 [Choanephora cucurbitarum]